MFFLRQWGGATGKVVTIGLTCKKWLPERVFRLEEGRGVLCAGLNDLAPSCIGG